MNLHAQDLGERKPCYYVYLIRASFLYNNCIEWLLFSMHLVFRVKSQHTGPYVHMDYLYSQGIIYS